jgi:hypothetical protein
MKLVQIGVEQPEALVSSINNVAIRRDTPGPRAIVKTRIPSFYCSYETRSGVQEGDRGTR